MKKLIAVMTTMSLTLCGCVLVPVDHPPHAKSCPPGQAKKGNC